MKRLDTFRQRWNETVTERLMSAPSWVASDEIFTQQRDQLIVTVHIENVPGGVSYMENGIFEKHCGAWKISASHRWRDCAIQFAKMAHLGTSNSFGQNAKRSCDKLSNDDLQLIWG